MLGVIHKTKVDLDFAVAQTPRGKIRGYWADEVFGFHGITYATARRFEMPEPVLPWSGVKEALDYGYVCPLMTKESVEATFFGPHRFWPMSEDCLSLNVWTRQLDEGAGKPVMVWLHGGGFMSGSSIEMYSYDGYQLAHDEDIVVVTVNHRLNILGYLDLSAFGEKYEYSGIAGMADLVEALRWVRENIRYFGGDPGNVTIAGQSGGGSKVAALMQMPAADGLYHKAIIQSGVPNFMGDVDKNNSMEYGRKIVKKLGLNASTIDEIQNIPYEQLVKAAQSLEERCWFVPVPVNDYYAGTYMQTGFRPETTDIPMIVGSNISEFSLNGPDGNRDLWSEAEKYAMLRDRFENATDSVIAAFTELYDDRPALNALSTDSMVRRRTKDFCIARSSAANAPVYNYMLTYDFPYKGGRQAWHCAEIPFIFRNAHYDLTTSTGGEDVDPLQNAMSGMWSSFIRTGQPQVSGLPVWQPFTQEQKYVYIFDKQCYLREKDDGFLLNLLEEYPPAPSSMMGARN